MTSKEKITCIEHGIPILPAYDDQSGSLWVFCQYCGKFHQHGSGKDGNGDGHRCAHCHDSSSGYDRTGYYIEKVGNLTKIQRAVDKIGERVRNNISCARLRRKKVFQNGEFFASRDEALFRLQEIIDGKCGASNGYIAEILRCLILNEEYRYLNGRVMNDLHNH